MNEQYRLFVGIDWAKEEHVICILNAERKVLQEQKIEHSGKAIGQFAEQLRKLCEDQPATVAVSMETPRGAIVDTLVERGFAVYSLNPKQMDRFRDRHTVAGAKDDRRDAFVLADSLRTDLHLFRKVKLDDPLVIRIRELSRMEEDIVQDQVRNGHRLEDLLNRYYPQALKLCPSVNKEWFWDLLELEPKPGQKVSAAKVTKILKTYRIRRWDGEAVKQILEEKALQLSPGAAEAASEHVLMILPQMRQLEEQRKELVRRTKGLLEQMGTEGQYAEHRDVSILLSLPGVGRVVTITMLSEASQPLSERDYHALRAYGGTAPVTKRSGKSKSIGMRRSCNPRLRNAIYHWSRVSVQQDEHSKKQYAELRSKGHTHGRALRGVGDRLLGVLVAMLKSGTPYERNYKKPVKVSAEGTSEGLASN